MSLECGSGEVLGGGHLQLVWEGQGNLEVFSHPPPPARLTHPLPSFGVTSMVLPAPPGPRSPPFRRKFKLL